jgi:Tol biopolymer transport system component
MGRGMLGTVLVVAVAAELMSSGVKPQERRDELPHNLEVSPALQAFVDRMWEASPTFRRQCRRLVAEPHAHVRLLLEDLPARSMDFKARSRMRWQADGSISAVIHVGPAPEATELIAHELEHVLEQLDGVDLPARAASGAAWKTSDGAYETRRAIETGRRVAREAAESGPVVASVSGSRGEAGGFLRTPQRDRTSTAASRPSARLSTAGRHLVFVSSARLVHADTSEFPGIYVLDLMTRQLTLESVGPRSEPADGWSANPHISGNGRYVVFESAAGNLTNPPVPRGSTHVFLRDRERGVTRLLSINAGGVPANGPSRDAAISADGTAVAFESAATDLLDGVPDGTVGIYLVRLDSGERVRVDVPATGGSTVIQSMSPSISADGGFVAFASRADLVCREPATCATGRPGSSRTSSVYVRDTHTGVTTRISGRADGREPDGASYQPSMSGDGRYVAFVSETSARNGRTASRTAHVYVHDRVTRSTELVSHRPDGRPGDGPSAHPSISGDGSVVAFQSLASDLICSRRCAPHERDINLVSDVFVFDRRSGIVTRASRDQGGEEWMAPSRGPSLDGSGRVLAFSSRQPVDEHDADADDDLFLRIHSEALPVRAPLRGASGTRGQ